VATTDSPEPHINNSHATQTVVEHQGIRVMVLWWNITPRYCGGTVYRQSYHGKAERVRAAGGGSGGECVVERDLGCPRRA
jgi:hypothetical protein